MAFLYWVSAIATVILAIFAVVTAWYARKAFREQSREVTDQAELLRVQSDQLAEAGRSTPSRYGSSGSRPRN